jgi:hypothetical protein
VDDADFEIGPLSGKTPLLLQRDTFDVDSAVSAALWRQPRTSWLYIGQSLASIATR